jgi:prepilin signal peptidase PulO-like enzyme (type II secretory pathway)
MTWVIGFVTGLVVGIFADLLVWTLARHYQAKRTPRLIRALDIMLHP